MASGAKKAKFKNAINNINLDLKCLADSLKNLNTDLSTMMKGQTDENGTQSAYWNGKSASKFYNKAITNLSNDIADYGKAYDRFEKVAMAFETLNSNDSSNG